MLTCCLTACNQCSVGAGSNNVQSAVLASCHHQILHRQNWWGGCGPSCVCDCSMYRVTSAAHNYTTLILWHGHTRLGAQTNRPATRPNRCHVDFSTHASESSKRHVTAANHPVSICRHRQCTPPCPRQHCTNTANASCKPHQQYEQHRCTPYKVPLRADSSDVHKHAIKPLVKATHNKQARCGHHDVTNTTGWYNSCLVQVKPPRN